MCHSVACVIPCRKNSMLLNNIPIIVGGLLETVAVHPFMLIIGRFGVGLNNGLLRIVTSNTVSPYLIYIHIYIPTHDHYIPHKTSNATLVYT